MKTILVPLLFCTLLPQLASAESLYKQLEELFHTSSTPYPLEQVVSQVPRSDEGYFAGCASAHLRGSTGAGYMDFYQIIAEQERDYGPLQPGPKKLVIHPVSSELINHLIFTAAKVSGNTFDVVKVSDVYKYEDCNDGTSWVDWFKNITQGLSADGKSLRTETRCNNGKIDSIIQYRKSKGYLAIKVDEYLVPNTNVLGTTYMYCWSKDQNPL